MAKAHSPVRLQHELMEQAKLAGSMHNRSASEQIEYWASIGRNVARMLDPETMIRINSGLAKIRVESTESGPLDPQSVFANLKAKQNNGELVREITSAPVQYRASKQHPGMLERIDENGKVEVGHFENGKFTQR
ncbi:MAG: hypothetical protein C9356_18895 [Oleiphilus sp.]|nr:MAG: hypothetical protein C9356_18895 [Oleiphilus sp.]